MWRIVVAAFQTVTAVAAAITGLSSPVTLGWDAPTGTSLGYRVTVDGVSTDVGLPPNNSLCGCPAFAFPLAVGSHTATVLAYNNAGAGLPSLPVTFTIVAGQPPGRIPNFIFLSDIPAPPLNTWLSTNVGASTTLGTSTVINGVWTLTSSGQQLAGRLDSFHYVYHLITGDGSVQVRVDSLVTGPSNGKGGITWRESTDANARHVSLTSQNDGTIVMKTRTVIGGVTTILSNDDNVQLPVWLRLTRVGQQINGYYSLDGMMWTGIASVQTQFNPTATYGLLMFSNQADPAIGLFTSLTRR